MRHRRQEAYSVAGCDEETEGLVYCLGGEGIYTEAIEHAGFLRLTEIDRDYEGNVRFPEYRHTIAGRITSGAEPRWREHTRRNINCQDEKNDERVDVSFVDYVRPQWGGQVLPWDRELADSAVL